MSITINNRPNLTLWSQNPIVFSFFYTGVNQQAKLQVQVIDTSNNVLAEVQYPFKGTTGSIPIDISGIIDALVSHSLPQLATGANPLLMTGQKQFKIRYREYDVNLPHTWNTDATIYKAFKGGIQSINITKDAEINNLGSGVITSIYNASSFLPNSQHSYLSYMENYQVITPDQIVWLAYFHESGAAYRVRYTLKYVDGTTRVVSNTVPLLLPYLGFWIPCGIEQCSLNPTQLLVAEMKVEITEDLSGPSAIVYSSYDFLIDNRPHYHSLAIFYRNSVGALETILLKGKIDNRATVAKKEYEQKPALNGNNPYYDSEIKLRWRANTGYITDAKALNLAEMLQSKDLYMIINEDWIALRITNTEAVLRSSYNRLNNIDIEFETASYFKNAPREIMQL